MEIDRLPPENTSRAAPAQPLPPSSDAQAIKISASAAASFLREFDPTGRHNIVAISPDDSSIEGWTFEAGEWSRMQSVIESRLRTHNLYFSLNEPRAGAPNKKLAKSDIASIRTISVDMDPGDGDLDEQRGLLLERLQAAVKAKLPTPSFVIDSGAGYHVHWLLSEKVSVEKLGVWAEDQARALAAELDGDSTHNLDRILRLPGTMNFPNAHKRSKGRAARPSLVRHRGPDRYVPMQLSNAVAPLADRRSGDDSVDPETLRSQIDKAREDIDASGFESITSLDDLDGDLHTRFTSDMERLPQLSELWEGKLEGTDQTASAFRLRLAQILGRQLTYDAASFALIAHAWPHAHGRNPLTARSLARDWVNIGESFARHLDHLGIQPIDGGQSAGDESTEKSSTAGIMWADPLDWDARPILPQRWTVKGWVPADEVTLLYGDGGIGKTLAVHQLAVSVAAGKPWLGQQTTRGRVMCFFCEDSEEVLMRRHRDILASAGLTNADLGGNLRIAPRKYGDNILALWDRNTGAMKRQAVWELLKNDALQFGANLLIVDTIADTFGGNEIDRGQVNAFIKSVLGRLAAEIKGTVIALGHPSVAGKTSGSGTSGSTAWSNAVRSRLYLRYPKGVEKGNIRELEGMKSNYGAKGNLLKLRWHKGAFDIVAASVQPTDDTSAGGPTLSSIERPVANVEDAVDMAVFDAVQAHPTVVMSLKSSSANFAPRILKMREPDILLPFSRDEIEASIHRMIARGALIEAEVGRDRAHRAQIGLAAIAEKAPGLAVATQVGPQAGPEVFN